MLQYSSECQVKRHPEAKGFLMNDPDLSDTMREYLTYIFRLSEKIAPNEYVATSDLANTLNVSAPAVNRMINKLRDLNLLNHERYQGIALTDEGRREALKHLRRHRIAEVFLVKVMGFGWHEVYHEAERMSAGLDEVLLTRMLEMTHFPTRCPHGAPIPSAEGDLPTETYPSLVAVEPEHDYQVMRIIFHEADRLEYLSALGLVPDAHIRLLHKAPFNGPLQLQLGREYRIIGFNLAEHIRVKAI